MRIPKKFYSEEFKRLKFAKKIETRRALWNECAQLGLEAERLAEETDAFNGKLVDLLRGQCKVDAAKLREELDEIFSKDNRITSEAGEFVKKASHFFLNFTPHYKGAYSNPLENKTHKIYKMLKHIEFVEGEAIKNIGHMARSL